MMMTRLRLLIGRVEALLLVGALWKGAIGRRPPGAYACRQQGYYVSCRGGGRPRAVPFELTSQLNVNGPVDQESVDCRDNNGRLYEMACAALETDINYYNIARIANRFVKAIGDIGQKRGSS